MQPDGKIGCSRAVPRLQITAAEIAGNGFDVRAYRRDVYWRPALIMPIPPRPLLPEKPEKPKRAVVQVYWVRPYDPIKDFIGPPAPTATNYELARRILAETATKHGVSINDVLARGHPSNKLAFCRHEIMWRIRQDTRWSLTRIGRFLGGLDHSSCVHGIRRHAERIGHE